MSADGLTLKVAEVSVLRLQPGDVLALRFDPATWPDPDGAGTGEASDQVLQALDAAGHGDVPVLAFWGGVQIEVVRPE